MIQLVPIAIGSLIRMAAPKVAKMLMNKGVAKKASQSAVKKAGSQAKRISAKDANKLAARSKPFVQTKTGAARKPPKTPTQKKIDKAKPGDALVPVKSKALIKKPTGTVAKKPTGAVTKKTTGAVAKKPSGAVTKATAPKKKIGPTKGDVARTAITVGGAAAVGGLEGLRKKNMAKAAGPDIPTPKRKPTPPSGTKVDYSPSRAIPKMDKPKAKPKDDAMTIKEYVEGAVGMKGEKGMEGGVRKVKTPFGVIEVDSSEEAFSNNKYGGQVKRNMGGKVRGVGKAIKGFGNANYSDKMY